jgi:hypothetical protein
MRPPSAGGFEGRTVLAATSDRTVSDDQIAAAGEQFFNALFADVPSRAVLLDIVRDRRAAADPPAAADHPVADPPASCCRPSSRC